MTAVWFVPEGTLFRLPVEYDEPLRATFEAVCGRCHDPWLDRYTEAFFDRFWGLEPAPYRHAMAAVADAFDLAADPEVLADALFEREVAATTVAPGARELLSEVAWCHRVGVLTDGLASRERAKLSRLGLLEDVEAVVSADGVGAHAPEAALFDAARRRIPESRRLLVATDADRYLRPARRRGLTPVRLGGEPVDGGPAVEAVADLATVLD